MQDGHDKTNGLIHAATNEYALMTFRAVVFVGVLYFSYIGTKILNSNDVISEKLNKFQYEQGVVIANMQGKVDVMGNRIDQLSTRLSINDNKLESLGNRLYEMVQRGIK